MLETVLCVDDDPITLMLCKKVIVKANFGKEIIFAQNGQEALDLFEKLKDDNLKDGAQVPQLVFLDLNMPVMNGWDFIEKFSLDTNSAFKNTKVIILSSTIDPADFNRAKQYNVVSHFLSKPITVEMLEKLKEIYS
ncbi:response regulator [Flavobacterium orientale]|uniref:Response regulator n=1 Tax=Flavobacterium orientale TaxID=1756020 RepID=A0A917DB68_9FLAO|nr:response regulator [Flavobacterium orientale]GGD25197.1 response regulator [Flavobacterium orientale]